MDGRDGYDMVRLGWRCGDCEEICEGAGGVERALESGLSRDAGCKADAAKRS